MSMKHAEHDLANDVRRQSLDVGVGCGAWLLVEHNANLSDGECRVALRSTRPTMSSRQASPYRFCDPVDRGQHHVFQDVGGGQRDVWRGDADDRAVEVVEGFVGDD